MDSEYLRPPCNSLCRSGGLRSIEFLIPRDGDWSRESSNIMRAALQPALKVNLKNSTNAGPMVGRARPKDFAVLFLLSAAAIAIHGYHPFVEDAEIYVPAIKKLLNP